MKFFKLMMIALVAMIGLSSCSESSSSDSTCDHDLTCDHDYIEVDYSKKLAGTWTCIEPENEYAEALVINADGSVTSTGVFDGQLWEKKGTYKIKGNKMTLSFEDGDNLEARFEMVEGVAFSMVDDELDVRYDYYYCENDLADEVVGMWVCTYVPWMDADMAINVYQADGKAFFTGFVGDADFDYASNVETTYKVIGDLMIQSNPMSYEGAPEYLAFRMDYSPNGSEYGDVLTNTNLMVFGDEVIETTASMIRIKQKLNLTGKTYDYISAYVSNAKGKDEDFSIVGNTFNMSNITAGDFDIMFRSVLSCIELNANSIKQNFRVNGFDAESETPITVDGNKVTLDMSVKNTAFRKVDMYMFQDADDCQLHIYMPTASFINYFASLEVVTMLAEGKIDANDATAVAKVFADMEARIESVNVSLVYKARE